MPEKPLILIIDDLKSNRMVIKKVLGDSYNFIEARDGQEALDILNSYEPMIILIDAIMPNMDGFETIKRIKKIEKFKRTPILMITSLGDMKTKVKALKYGVNDFLTKPFDKCELRARCESFIEMVNLNKECLKVRINPDTGFKNEIAFLQELHPNDAIFLFSVNKFYKADAIYGYKNTKILEQKIGLFIQNMAQQYLKDISFYHIGYAKFIVKVENKEDFNDEYLEKLCKRFYNNCKNHTINFNDMCYSPIVTIIFAKDRVNLYEDALSALSYAKNNNFKYLYSQIDLNGISEIISYNIKVIKKIKEAIKNDKIINYYQPIFDCKKEKITKYETLVRLNTLDGDTLSPYHFLNIAKNAYIYNHITRIVYQKAFDKFKYTNFEFSINISYMDIDNREIKKFIYELLYTNPHISDKIIFEISENDAIENLTKMQIFIEKVREYGAKIAIDNFGSTFSNFQRIIELEPDYVKIDSSIVKNILSDTKNYILLDSINQLCHNLNIKTIAEFVSSKELFEELQYLSIDYLQGYYIGKPSPYLLDEREKESFIETC